jgi:5-methylthioadenosine/S-adenosylhomocysteine deaminase
MSFVDFYTAANTGPASDVPGPREELVGRPRHTGGYALKGCVLAPDEVLDPGFVVVDPSGVVAAVTSRTPSDVFVLDTDGVILPGLIDLHNHPEYNVFPPWEPPEFYANRYQWRASSLYHQLIVDPQDRLLPALPRQTQLRYSEIRALVGGVTAIQGANRTDAATSSSLIRTVDQQIFGEHSGRAVVDVPTSDTGWAADELRRIVHDIANGAANAFYVHLAEGARDDPESQSEFARLVHFDAITPATIVIHGVALSVDQLADLRDAGGKLVWSPQSNLRLYGETTRAADALELGLPLGIGADWLPSGSPSLLAELRTARQVVHRQGYSLSAKQLTHLVTHEAARIAALDDHLGTLAAGRVADVVVLQRLHSSPWESVLLSDRADVRAVFVQGSLAYGEQAWAAALGLEGDDTTRTSVIAWGRRMMLDTGTEEGPSGPTPAPTLTQLRSAILNLYLPLGPVFA